MSAQNEDGAAQVGTVPETANQNIDQVAHYDGDRCMRAIEDVGYGTGFAIASAMKYLWRHGKKHDDVREEVGKAMWYLNRVLSHHVPVSTRTLRVVKELQSMCREVQAALDAGNRPPDLRDRIETLRA